MTFRLDEAKQIAASVRSALPNDRALSVMVSVILEDRENGDQLDILMTGLSPFLTVRVRGTEFDTTFKTHPEME